VGEQGEGMKHYTQYLMQNKVNKEIEREIQDMFNKTVMHQGDLNGSFLEGYIQFSDYYGQVQRILIGCIDHYSPQIFQLFDFDSMLSFLSHLDTLAQQKAL
jgi:hypothetical protein